MPDNPDMSDTTDTVDSGQAAATEQNIIDAAMQLCAERGWRSLRMVDIADAAALDLTECTALFTDKSAILNALYNQWDTSLNLANDMPDESTRDKLFAIMMERLDMAAPYRTALLKMRNEGVPKLVLCRGKRWLNEMLIKAGTPPHWRPLHSMALAVIWTMILPTWFNDDSPDLSKTMAAVDTQLGHAEQAWLSINGWWLGRSAQDPL